MRVGVVVASATVLAVAPAAAAPDWSALNATHYSGSVPAEGGMLVQSAPLASSLSVPGAGRAYRILYSTTNQHDAPAVSTAAVFVPKGRPPAGGWPVIAWAHGTVGLGDDCAPSANPRSERDKEYLSHWLDLGYVIVATDYAGLGTPGLMSYLDSVPTAHYVVDSVVAVHKLPALQAELNKKWAIVGQSQGGGAAVNSAAHATAFSAGSGLDYRGVIATGTPYGLETMIDEAGPDTTLPAVTPPVANAYAAYILAGFSEANPQIDVASALTPVGKQAAKEAATMCLHPLTDALARYKPTEFFAKKLGDVPGLPQAMAAYMGTPTSGYDRPVFLGVGLEDTDVPPQCSEALAKAMKANGVDVQLHEYPKADHSGAVIASMRDSTPFLQKIMAG
ncbi:prolyl oligopeptidase family serine peptidase [Tsukamurella soli]|uniref:Prolyl oligopeptidase family serine peptidase n=1 Tax=Tsukamurella soli TaxID=644556 RepID=A0ABP8JYS3_9ACTN